MRKAWIGGLMASALGMGLMAAPAQAQNGNAAKCTALGQSGLAGGTGTTAKWIEADTAKGMPAFCELTATLTPAPGSQIGVVYRLPEKWNGKLLGLGGGGWAGNVALGTAAPGLKAGYATAQTNGGHPSTSPWEVEW